MANNQNLKLAVPFFTVMNISKSIEFYVAGLGFEIKNKWIPRGKIEWCWLERDGVAIMMQEPTNKQHFIYKRAQPLELGFVVSIQCEDALLLYQEFIQKGFPVSEPFVGNNMWVFHINDPDGYRIEFESKTDVPEETLYSEWRKNNQPG